MSANLRVVQVVAHGYDHDGAVHEVQPFVISAEYHNESDYASGPFQVTFVIDGHYHHAIDVHDAGARESQWAQWPTDGIVAGAHHVRVGFAGQSHESEHLGEAYDQEFHVVATPTTATGQDGRDEDELATGYVNAQLGILRQWQYALLDFDKVMVSETQKATHPDFAGALVKLFDEKVLGYALGKIPAAAHADLVFGALKAVVEAGEKAKAASVSVALRDFYHQHLTMMSEMDKHLVDAQEHFAPEMRRKAASLMADGNADGYLAFRTGLIALHDDAVARLHGASLETYVDALSAEWMNQSIKDPRYDVAIHIRILQSDLSVLGFKIEGPDGDKLTEHLGAQAGGIDLWALPAPRSIAYYARDGENPAGWVHLDRATRLIETPAEQGVSRGYQEVYARLHAQGHLIAHGAGS
jgi:hypothetical protein